MKFKSNRMSRVLWVAAFLCPFGLQSASAGISDFTTWTLVQDPPNANFTGSSTPTQATLLAASGAIPSGTDIGYQSVNGQTPATSTAGHAFDPAASFSVAIDFDLKLSNTPTGSLALGFGIGEDRDGMNSAGVVLYSLNGAPAILFGAAARINDITQLPQAIAVGGSLSGSLFASYDAASGNVVLGASTTAGAASPAGTATFAGIQNSWAGGLLLASFFLRSDNTLGPAWQSGTGVGDFSNFRVLSGTTIEVPEPASLAILLTGAAGRVLTAVRRRCGRRQ